MVHEEPVFVDQGENFDEVRCQSCGQELEMEWWQDAMDSAGENGFAKLAVQVPCCKAKTSLNDLQYRYPAGFARFVLEASEPSLEEFLDRVALAQLEEALQTPLRQTIARY